MPDAVTDSCRSHHEQAMKLAEEAQAKLREATRLETLAAHKAGTTEPARSVLYRSAAELALASDQPVRCAQLAEEGLRGSPPAEVAHELRGVISRAHATGRVPGPSKRHLPPSPTTRPFVL